MRGSGRSPSEDEMVDRSYLKTRIRTGLKQSLRLAAASFGTLVAPRLDAPRVLTYHGVCPRPTDEWSVTPELLRDHMQLVAREYSPVALRDIVEHVRSGRPLPPRAVAVTFDDGFLDVLAYAAPVLAEAGIPGTVFVAPALVGRGVTAADPSFHVGRPLMKWSDVRTLARGGWTIGSHTSTHPVLARLSAAAARSELSASRACLEQRLGMRVDLLAYPYGTPGCVSARDVELARSAGYVAAFMSVTAPLRPPLDLLALPRSKVLATDGAFNLRAILSGRLDSWARVERSH